MARREVATEVDARQARNASVERAKGRIWSIAADDLPRIGAPATRALASIGVTRLDQVAGRSADDLLALHGLGPRAVRLLDEALADAGLAPLVRSGD